METNPNPTPTPNPTPNPAPNPTPAPDERQKEIDRLLKENGDLRKATKDQETTLSTVTKKLSELEKQGLRSTGDWQKLAETHEGEAKTWKEKFETANSAFVETLRSSKVKEEVAKLGVHGEALDDIDAMDLSAVQVKVENGKMVVSGHDVFASNLKKLKPYMFKVPGAPIINPGANGGGAPGAQDLKSLEKVYQEAFKIRASKPEEFKAAREAFNKAVIESRKAKK